jgi:hypothetical protein
VVDISCDLFCESQGFEIFFATVIQVPLKLIFFFIEKSDIVTIFIVLKSTIDIY